MTREHASKQTRMPKGIGPGHLRMATRYPPAPFGQGLASRHVHPPIPAAARVCDIRHTPRMGLTAAAAAAQAARLTPSPPEATTNTAAPGRGHRRGSTRIDRTRTDAIELRGVPIAGHGISGVIPGTKPGDSAAALEAAGRDILRAELKRNRYQR